MRYFFIAVGFPERIWFRHPAGGSAWCRDEELAWGLATPHQAELH